ncbi:MAG TPA: DUF6701 domain-containing protein [Burkholderiales bacterium]|nr:DUF6701 domain-containing protein [Burkholderiales bacterium]
MTISPTPHLFGFSCTPRVALARLLVFLIAAVGIFWSCGVYPKTAAVVSVPGRSRNDFGLAFMKIICTVLAFVVLILGLPAVAGAAVAFDAAASTSSAASSTTFSWTHTASGANRVVIVGVSYISPSATATATYGGTSMTLVGSQFTAADSRMAMFSLVNPPTGAQTVTVTLTAAPTQGFVGGSVSFTGANQTTPTGTFVSAIGTTSPASLTVTSATGELVIDTLQCDNGCVSITPGGSQTQRWNLNAGAGGNFGGGSTAAGAATVTTTWTFTSDNWAYGAVSVKAAVGATTIGGFNAYETSTAAGAITGVIKTKIAGATVSLDMIALNAAKTAIATTFTGTVRVEVLDASNNSGALDANNCRPTWTVIQTLSPDPTFVAGDNGRKTISFTQANSYPEARLRITFPAGAPTVTGCSTDNFAIRPNTFASYSVTDTDWQTAGTVRTLNTVAVPGGVTHKAGRPFTVRATAVNAAGTPATTTNYAGTPTPTLTACAGTACTATFGTFTLGASFAAGVLTSNVATYGDVGSFALQLVDSTFSNVDAADGSTTAERNITSAVINVGRFAPDHFAVSLNTPVFGTACGSFTYIGQPFSYTTQPVITVTAQNFTNGTTTRYTGALWQITNASLTGKAYTAASGTLNTSGLPGTDPVIVSTGAGVGTLTFSSGTGLFFTRTTPTAPASPYNADISLAINVIDADGVILASNPASFGTATAGNGIAFSSGKPMRFGRLRLGNALGSELLDLPVPLLAEYWNGTDFVTNTLDNCTSIAAANVVLSNYQGGLSATNMGQSHVSISGTFSSGAGNLKLTKPSPAATGSVDLCVDLDAGAGGDTTCVATTPANKTYLQGVWSGTNYNRDPSARAGFGLNQNTNRFIYRRENF